MYSYCDVYFEADNKVATKSATSREGACIKNYHGCSCFSRDSIRIFKPVDDCRKLWCILSRFVATNLSPTEKLVHVHVYAGRSSVT